MSGHAGRARAARRGGIPCIHNISFLITRCPLLVMGTIKGTPCCIFKDSLREDRGGHLLCVSLLYLLAAGPTRPPYSQPEKYGGHYFNNQAYTHGAGGGGVEHKNPGKRGRGICRKNHLAAVMVGHGGSWGRGLEGEGGGESVNPTRGYTHSKTLAPTLCILTTNNRCCQAKIIHSFLAWPKIITSTSLV